MVEILEPVSCHRHIDFSLTYWLETVNWFCPDSFEKAATNISLEDPLRFPQAEFFMPKGVEKTGGLNVSPGLRGRTGPRLRSIVIGIE